MIIILIALVMAALLASAIYGLYWASEKGQFREMQNAAKVIFDRDENIGQITDAFPQENWLHKKSDKCK